MDSKPGGLSFASHNFQQRADIQQELQGSLIKATQKAKRKISRLAFPKKSSLKYRLPRHFTKTKQEKTKTKETKQDFYRQIDLGKCYIPFLKGQPTSKLSEVL